MLVSTFNKPSFPVAGVVVRSIQGERGSVCINNAWAINAYGAGDEKSRPEASIAIIGRHSADPHECDAEVAEIKRALELA